MNSLVISNIRQRPLRSTISVIGVSLGVALVMLFTGLARGMSNDLQRRSSNMRAEILFTRPGSIQINTSSTNLSTKYVERLRQIEGVESATPVIRYFYPSGSFGVDQIEGVEWNDFAKMNNVRLVQGREPRQADEVVIDETKAAIEGQSGVQVVFFDAVTPGEKDFSAILTKVKSLAPAVTYYTGYYPEGGLIAKQFKELGVPGKFMAGDANNDPTFISEAGNAS